VRSSGWIGRAGTALAAALMSASVLTAPAHAAVDTGPPLSVRPAALAAGLHCPADLEHTTREVVLLVPGTTMTAVEAYSWTYMPAFDALGIPYCYVEPPDRSMGDIQVSAEYSVYGIREIHRRTGRKVQILGWSQGGTQPRWALRWWPDLRAMVDDYVGITPSAHGGRSVNVLCTPNCPPSFWQQRDGAEFEAAMNSGRETFPGIDYTVVWTHFEQVVTPAEHSTIAGATNIATQDICPSNTGDHFALGTYDPVAYAVVLDALTHAGPADPARIDRSVCGRSYSPFVDPITMPLSLARMMANVTEQYLTYLRPDREPPLRDYARHYARS